MIAQGKPSISAVLPALNEEANLNGVANEVRRVLERVASRFEIVIVDDGSTDQTARVAAELAEQDAHVRVVRHEKNRGYGAALRSGIAAAMLDWVFLTDADGQFPMEQLEDLVATCTSADAVIGYRVERADPWRRRLYARLWNVAVRATLGVRVRDLNCAFKLVRRSLLADLDLGVSGGAINAEILAGLGARKATILEVPVLHRPREKGEQTGGRPRVILRALWELIRLARARRSDGTNEPRPAQ